MGETLLETGKKPRILVILEPYQNIERLLRIAQRKAQTQGYDWEAVTVETPASTRLLKNEEKTQLLQNITLAKQMGAIITQRHAKTLIEGVQDLLDERNTQNIVIASIKVGKKNYGGLLSRLVPSTCKRIHRAVGNKYHISEIHLGQEVITAHPLARVFSVNLNQILQCLLAVALATLAIQVIDFLWPGIVFNPEDHNKAILYIIACAFAAGRFGLFASILTAAASFVTLSLVHIAPYQDRIIDDAKDASNLALFLLATIIISYFGSRDHRERELQWQRADRFQSLLQIHRVSLNKKMAKEAIDVLGDKISKLLGTEIAFFMPQTLNPNKLEAIFHEDLQLSEADQKALSVCWEESKTTGVGSPYDPGCHWRFEPLLTARDEIGVLGVHITSKVTVDPSFGKLQSSIADQSAMILERLELGLIAEENRVQAEREKLRSMLLSSVSHDLKTPLASVIGSLSVFRSMGERLTLEQRTTLINTALAEAHRLDSFITNILDMTRIESGQVEVKPEWILPERIIDEARKRLRDRLSTHEIVYLPSQNVEIFADSILTQQVLLNLLDNAAKYTPAGTRIDIGWQAGAEGFSMQIRDYGAGIPDDKLSRVFDKYERLQRQDSQVAGTGLGLAIARAVIRSQKGDIIADNHPEGGAVFTITLPQWREAKEPVKEVA